MKLVFVLLTSILLLGCLGQQGQAYNLYEDKTNNFSFEKPASWTQQPDPLATVRFGDLQNSTFSVSITANNANDFDKTIDEIYTSFSQNTGLYNVQRFNTTLAGLDAVKISSDQNLVNETTRALDLVYSNLYIVKDAKYNRIIVIGFISKTASPNARETEQKILNSFKITNA